VDVSSMASGHSHSDLANGAKDAYDSVKKLFAATQGSPRCSNVHEIPAANGHICVPVLAAADFCAAGSWRSVARYSATDARGAGAPEAGGKRAGERHVHLAHHHAGH